MALELSQFSVNRAVIEIRYAFAYALWDRAGSLAADIKKKHFPELELLRPAQPNNQSLRLTSKLQLSIEAEKSFLLCGDPGSDLAPLKDGASKLFPLLIDRLELTDFARIGLRVFFSRPLADKAACADYILAVVPALRREGKFFNIDAHVTDPALALRWEGPTTGCMVNLHINDAKLNIDVPLEFPTDLPRSLKHTAVSLDADYYAHGLTAASKFNAAAIIENWSRLIRRDVGAFINA